MKQLRCKTRYDDSKLGKTDDSLADNKNCSMLVRQCKSSFSETFQLIPKVLRSDHEDETVCLPYFSCSNASSFLFGDSSVCLIASTERDPGDILDNACFHR